MLTRKKLFIIFIVMLSISALIYAISIISPNMNKTLKKNYGLSNMTINVYGKGGTSSVTDIDSVVPSADELVKNLTEKGYSITRYDKIDNLDISVQRIYAERNDRFIDICYGLTDADAKTVFDHFEDVYNKYYLLAQNESYVYCIGDKKTFKYAGFKSLANDGIQYIYE